MKTTKQQGFTLIELVIVIIILGILAVTAAPKFLDLSSDARKSTLSGLEAALKGGANLVYSKSAIGGIEKESTGSVSDGNNTINTVYGYPESNANYLFWVDANANDWNADTTTSGQITFRPSSVASGADCTVVYTDAADENTPATAEIGVDTGC
ncbi:MULTISPECIES: prepilin-type N-terminal cleavage/methylation domain-containing protein [unclassified Agarivorans]|uniref:prepilin-type N-terminal cleavage/methylation domain-containing protein n=1 Tax=unclassified Agarivorans TaxID=2636026 RepID=UPI0026E41F16|nr:MULTISPECIES: prepilin-type N-terminal cleavage/methylation domain-containing protein [unclassified Agarivorans]MDO6686850.1 prepilin-type N-terminal cleavage/methylation domain-containing protein [Agarivorans sp. 3_MG-2023]MDO6716647.1 prepilin-type N-terminal cleavage/methylation domain-containing protein [Agarivorans sp. 2_MG-2023]